MRVMLAIAPWSFATVHPGSVGRRGLLNRLLGTVGGPSEPLGLLYIAAVLRERGHQVILRDGALVPPREILEAVTAHQPEVVGFSSMRHNWASTRWLIRQVRQALPRARLVLGGPQASCWQEETLQECAELDYAVVGEGERPMARLCAALERGGRGVGEIPGLIYRDGARVVVTPPRAPERDLDSLPLPDYSLVDLRRYRPSVGFYNRLPSMNIITSRGCNRRCSFCTSEGRLRQRSVDAVVAELELMVRRHGVQHVTFYDEGLTFSRRRTLELCRKIRARGLDLSWCANARVDEVDEQLLMQMRQAGCWKLLFGLESGVQKNLDAVGKGTTVQQAWRAVRLTREAGIETFATFLFGIPGETYDEGLQTIEMACRLGLDYAAFLNLVPYKGSQIYDDLPRYGRLTGKWSTNLISFVPHSMTFEQMARLNELAARRFYRRPSYLLGRLRAMRSLEDLRRNLRGLVAYTAIKSTDY